MADGPKPETLAQPRAIEHLAPGSWWLVDYLDDRGSQQQIWAEVRMTKSLTRQSDGTKFIEITGIDTEGDLCDLFQLRGFGVPQTLRKADAKRCGLTVPQI